MPILNYTTTIDPMKTVGEIQSILAKHGATSIAVDFANGLPVALTFMVNLNGEFINFRLPSNHQGVYKAICKAPEVARKYKTEEQARRVSWRIVKDWVESQMAIVEAHIATLPQVFLPYMVHPSGLTLYEAVEKNGFKALTGSDA